ncbi:MAG: hypothetical protein ACTSV0_11585 [Candidatus Freyarchaeota archaeon]
MPVIEERAAEKVLKRIIASNLRSSFREVFVDINLASNRFYPDWEKWWGPNPPPAQPDIDLLLVDHRHNLWAIEIKYIKLEKGGKTNYSYYAGLDQALALLRFGFSGVSLWHCFDAEIPLDKIKSYVKSLNSLLLSDKIFSHRPPIEYESLLVDKVEGQIKLKTFNPDFSMGERIPSGYGYQNPLRETYEAKKIDDFLRRVLKIP